ncbi:MAG: hypothetical protein FD138_522 [Planctomycetota bacterium]|nr:MAG: hypothetical protein FD138_522 [Planctomycetota bacterium]
MEPTWTTTSFFPKTTTLPLPGRRRRSPLMPAPLDSTIACRRITKTMPAIPPKKVVPASQIVVTEEANQDSKRMDSSVVVVVAVVVDAVMAT